MREGGTVRRDECVNTSQQTAHRKGDRNQASTPKPAGGLSQVKFWNQMKFSWRLHIPSYYFQMQVINRRAWSLSVRTGRPTQPLCCSLSLLSVGAAGEWEW